ncbi:hypothetical protein KC852_01360 [Candidatus Nomurabacteria bacterium]|nr:hypothetical protein [Candidatus Nomurabacteria bacterium]
MTNNMVPIEKVTTFSANNAESMINYFGIESVFINKKPETRLINFSGTVCMYREVVRYYKLSKIIESVPNYEKYNLVDLGSNGDPFIIRFAKEMKIPGLVCVDIWEQFEPESEKFLGDLPMLGIQMDMLAFLENLPNKCTNISMFAIDIAIICDKSYRNEMYHHLSRVVPDDGVVFSMNSIMENHPGFESLKSCDYIYRKKI